MTQEQIEQFLKQEQEETTESLWGCEVTFKPYLLQQVFGDGMILIYFSTLDDRPYYWLVRVDSSVTDMGELDSEEIHQAIEEECGCYYNDYDEYNDEPKLDEDGYDEFGYKHKGSYPEIVSDTSPHWGMIADLKKGVDKIGFPLKLKEEKK